MSMVKTGQIKNTECIQCGACIAGCPKQVLSYTMTPMKKTVAYENNKKKEA